MNDAEIIVRFTSEGWHHYPDAPMERAYLAYLHRHLFHVEASIEVLHDDREIEFHDFLDFCRAAFPTGRLGAQSCEMLARDLANKITLQWSDRRVIVSVFEDGEVGARVSVKASPPEGSGG